MVRVRRILETALDCDDLPRTAAFYTALLDVTPMLDSDRLVAIDAGEGTVLLLFQRGAAGDLETPGGIIPGHDSGGPGHLAFAIDAPALADWESRREAELRAVASRAGSGAIVVPTDVTRRGDVERLRDRAIAELGHVDVWVNNAGRGITKPVLELTDEELDQMITINVKSALYGMQ